MAHDMRHLLYIILPFDPCPKSFGPVQKHFDWHKNSFESVEGWGNGLRKYVKI